MSVTTPMVTREDVAREIADLPEPVLDELMFYIRYLKAQADGRLDTALLSEAALAEDWLRPEEDAAWADL